MVEGPGQLAAIALLTGSGQKTKAYEKLRQDNATDLLRTARRRPDMEPLLEGFDLDLRTAQAHRMVRYSDDGVTAETRQRLRATAPRRRLRCRALPDRLSGAARG